MHRFWRALGTTFALAPAALLPVWAGAAVSSAPLRFEATNPLPLARPSEVLALPLDAIRRQRPEWRPTQLAVRIEGQSRELPVQPYASTGGDRPDQLLVLLDLPAHGRLRLAIAPRPPQASPVTAGCLHGRHVPERDDDFAWENALVGFRIYGPALQAKGETSSGIDVWSKRPSGCAIDNWYRRDAASQRLHDPSLSYHRDDGVGLDSYAVGHTPGDGGTAAWVAGAAVFSGNMLRARVTARGPVRLRVDVDYAPWRAGAATVHEHKVVTLDAGSRMNRQQVRYRLDGAPSVSMMVGLTVHDPAEAIRRGTGWIAVWGNAQRADAGQVATGLVLPAAMRGRARALGTDSAQWLRFTVRDGDGFSFASGAGWSKGGIPDFATWQHYLADYRMRWDHPLSWRWLP